MMRILGKLTFGHPYTLIRPALWIFFEDFFNLFPAIIIYVAINLLTGLFIGTEKFHLKTFVFYSLILFLLAAFQFLIGFGAFRKSFIPVAENTADDRIKFIRKLRRLPLGYFSKKESGELINNFANDFIKLQQAVTGYLTGIFSVILSCLLTSIFLFIFEPLMAAAFYIAIPIASILLIFSMKILEKNSIRVALAKDRVATGLNEYLLGIKILKSFNQTGEGFTKLKNSYHHLMKSCIKEESGSGSLVRLCTSIVQFGLPLMCIAGSYLLLGGKLSIVSFISIIIIGTKILTPIIVVVSRMMSLRASYISAKRLDNTMTEAEMTGESKSPINPEIEFKNVYFSYSGNAPVIEDVSFKIPKGRLTALVGPSGSGKSTLLRLIARFWDIDFGELNCNGRPLIEISPENWLNHISMVLQDVYLFNETIRENILFGRKDADENQMIEAAKTAGCHNFISKLIDGYDTIVGEGGSTLSGGEKQRISIARAILKNAPILLLDEPTSSLDAKNEILIQNAVSELVKDKTVVMIAHRLKTIQHADQILVIDNGKIVEQGVHDELIENNNLYTRLWNMQQKSLTWNF